MELLPEGAVLADRGVGVVAGHRGLQHEVVVRAVPQAEVGAPVRHVEADRTALLEELADRPAHAVRRPHMVPLAPVVEPAAPELAAHERLPVPTQGGRHRHPGAESERRHRARHAPVRDHVRSDPVGRRQHLHHAPSPEPVTQVGEVGGVAAERSVLVLDLDRHDRPAVRGLQGREPRKQRVVPGIDGGEERGIARPQRRDPPGEPEGETAVGPLRADIGARPEEHVETDLAGQPHEALDVLPAVEADVPFDPFVEVPGDIGVDRVRAHRGEPAQAVLPLVRVHAEIVDRARQDAVRRTVAEDLPVAPGQGGGAGGGGVCRRGDGGGEAVGSRGEKVGHCTPS